MGRNDPVARAVIEPPPRALWQAYCAMVPDIRRLFGVNNALAYLVGEKLMGFSRSAESEQDFGEELPAFCQRIRELFTTEEIQGYFDSSLGSDGSRYMLADSEAERDRRVWVKAMLLQRGS